MSATLQVLHRVGKPDYWEVILVQPLEVNVESVAAHTFEVLGRVLKDERGMWIAELVEWNNPREPWAALDGLRSWYKQKDAVRYLVLRNAKAKSS